MILALDIGLENHEGIFPTVARLYLGRSVPRIRALFVFEIKLWLRSNLPSVGFKYQMSKVFNTWDWCRLIFPHRFQVTWWILTRKVRQKTKNVSGFATCHLNTHEPSVSHPRYPRLTCSVQLIMTTVRYCTIISRSIELYGKKVKIHVWK